MLLHVQFGSYHRKKFIVWKFLWSNIMKWTAFFKIRNNESCRIQSFKNPLHNVQSLLSPVWSYHALHYIFEAFAKFSYRVTFFSYSEINNIFYRKSFIFNGQLKVKISILRIFPYSKDNHPLQMMGFLVLFWDYVNSRSKISKTSERVASQGVRFVKRP